MTRGNHFMPLSEKEGVFRDFGGLWHEAEWPRRGPGNLKANSLAGAGQVSPSGISCRKMPQFYVVSVSSSGARVCKENIQGFLEEKNLEKQHLLAVELSDEDGPLVLRGLF